jgi:hypothetical protein
MAGQKLTPDMWAYLLGTYCQRLGPLNLEGTRQALVRRGLLDAQSTRYSPALSQAGRRLVNKVLVIVP